MTVCEVCGGSTRRRSFDHVLEKWICGGCAWQLIRMDEHREELLKYIRRLEEQVRMLNREKYEKASAKPMLRFTNCFSAVPPKQVIDNALLALTVADRYNAFSQVLADYYGITAPPYLINNEKIPEDAIACYYGPPTNIVYTREKGEFSHRTAFHEFYHALQFQGAVPNPDDKAERERDAEWFAKACVKVEEKLK